MKPLFDHAAAIAHIAAADPRLGEILPRLQPYAVQPQPMRSLFARLLRSIIYQQLHGKAAATIHARVLALLPDSKAESAALAACTDAQLRAAGLSQNKLLAVRDLSAKALDGTVPSVAAARKLSDEDLIERLTAVRGIGRWTVQMVLLFDLGRPDVWPTGDFGVRGGFQKLYRKRRAPTPAEMDKYAERWRPYRSVVAWYCWRIHELESLD